MSNLLISTESSVISSTGGSSCFKRSYCTVSDIPSVTVMGTLAILVWLPIWLVPGCVMGTNGLDFTSVEPSRYVGVTCGTAFGLIVNQELPPTIGDVIIILLLISDGFCMVGDTRYPALSTFWSL